MSNLPEAYTDRERQLSQDWGVIPTEILMKKMLSWGYSDIFCAGRWHFDSGNCPNEVQVSLDFLDKLHSVHPIFSVEERLALYKHLFSFVQYIESVELYEGWSSTRRFNNDKILDVFAFHCQSAGRPSADADRQRSLILCALLSREKGIWHTRQWEKIWDKLCPLSIRTPTLIAGSEAALVAHSSSFKGANLSSLLRKNMMCAAKSHLNTLRQHDHSVLASHFWGTLFNHWLGNIFGGGANLRGMFRSWANISYDEYVSLPVDDFRVVGKKQESLRAFHEERALRRERNLRRLATREGGNKVLTKV